MDGHIPEPFRHKIEPQLTYHQMRQIKRLEQEGKGFKSTSCSTCAPKDKSQFLHASEKRGTRKSNPFKSVFASNTDRFRDSDGPFGSSLGPGTYNHKSDFKRSDRESVRASAPFKSSGRRSPVRDIDVAPHYTFLDDQKTWLSKGSYISTLSRGSKGGNYFPDSNIIGQPDPKAKTSTKRVTNRGLTNRLENDTQTYSIIRSQTDRFPKDPSSAIPGPNYYQQVKHHRRNLKNAETAAFRSTTERSPLPELKIPGHQPPPPGTYSPSKLPSEWSNKTYRINCADRKTVFEDTIRGAEKEEDREIIDGKRHLALTEQVARSPRRYKVLSSNSPRFSNDKTPTLTAEVPLYQLPSSFDVSDGSREKSRRDASIGLGFGSSEARWTGVMAGEENPNTQNTDSGDAEWLKLRRQREAGDRQAKRERAIKERGGLGDFRPKDETEAERHANDLLTGEVFNLRRLETVNNDDYDLTNKFEKYYRKIAYQQGQSNSVYRVDSPVVDEFSQLPSLDQGDDPFAK